MPMFKAIEKNPPKTRYDGEDNDEHILLVLRRSVITNLGWLFLTFILFIAPLVIFPFIETITIKGDPILTPGLMFSLTLFWYLFSFGYVFQKYTNWFFNVYIVTSKKIVDMDFIGVLYKNISECTLDNIEDVTSTIRGTFGTIFNIGNVFIQTAAEKTEFEFEAIDDPSRVRDTIADISAKYKETKGFIKHDD